MAELQQKLQKLAETILKTVTDAKANGAIQPEQEVLWKWNVNEFEYGESGITQSQASGQYITRKAWFKASLTLLKAILEAPEFSSVLADLQTAYPTATKGDFERFAGAILQNYLSIDSTDEVRGKNEETQRRFLNDLSGGLVLYNGKVELQGVTLQPTSISLNAGINLRQPTREDLEKETRLIGPWGHTMSHPSAILEVELRATRGSNALLQGEIEKAVALLRLYDVGSVKWSSYETWSDSLLDLFGQGATMKSGEQSHALETYYIKAETESNLKKFWHSMSASLPKDVYALETKQVSHITLAYDRYSDGLLHNGIFERRIANAVMGVEALFLEENQELSYRLELRTSKLLSLVGRNPLEVRRIVHDCYGIRSAFAHGGHSTYKQKKKLEGRYGNLKKVLYSILDYLRVSIVVMIFCRAGKDEIVDLLDDSLLDSGQHLQLQNRVHDAKAVLEA